MKTLIGMTMFQFQMLLRNKELIIASLGLAVVSMLIFGYVFGTPGTPALRVGIADNDKSAVSSQIVGAMKNDKSFVITEGSQTELVQQMKDGKLSGVVVVEQGFGTGLVAGNAKVQLYVDESDVIGSARTRATINAVFDSVSKQATGYKELVQVQEQKIAVRSMRQIDYLTPGMLGLSIMFANMFTGVALINWRERGTLKRLSATPLKAWQLIVSQIISQITLSLGQAVIILTIAQIFFNIIVKPEWLPLLFLFVIIGSFSIISLGYAIGNFSKDERAAQATINLIAFPMMFLSGSYFVVEPPDFLKLLVDILPLTHLNRALRSIMLNNGGIETVWVSLAVLSAIGVGLLILSVRTFRWNSK
jgi:ABC-2 type transport system permease protein